MDNQYKLNLISEEIIGCAFTVSNTLGAGFLEKVYQNALAIELLNEGLEVEKEKESEPRMNTKRYCTTDEHR